MFGSNDDKKAPAEAGEKKGLFSWFRKKPQQAVAEQPQSPEPQAAEPVAPQAPVEQPAPVAEAPVVAPAPVESAPAAAPQPPAGAPVLPVAEDQALAAPVGAGLPANEATPSPALAGSASQPASTLTLPVAEEPVALVPDLEPRTPPVIPERPAPEPVPAEVRTERPEPVPVAAPAPVEPVPAPDAAPTPVEPAPEPVAAAPAVAAEPSKVGFFARLKQGLSKTSASIGEGMASLFLGKKVIDDDLLDEIETRLLTADVGVEATSTIVQNLTQKVARKQLADADALYKSLQEELAALLRPVEQPLTIQSQGKPYVILVVGVNGAGKTTTIGKLAKKLQLEGKKVMLAAGDTFRAAAVEQLQVWGERNQIPVIAQHTGADSASVIFDAVQAAKARGIDVLIADTAGRLHTKDNLMEELKKVRRVIGKLDAEAPHEVLLVLDAGTGQNAISQAKYFNQSVELTGLALTKLDGTAKGGVIFALAKQFALPIRFIGVGEGIDDLRTFEAEPFVKALFAEREHP
ncbi:signal recognition particle-docking protein FtsY [Pseudomonas guariconensis]|uniref:signal recognition particle-docking protein FtsY n=1 Tax=Pseudomonas TaxID=286 RepID=UPI001CE42469|nr:MULTISPECIES: signal recognition particle-docking protein FtsY [Pseudomonas]MCO7636110.1 signal recognition particle-docking protein FtsY [Pseudomonas sp. S 311-6]MCO7513195.1 signal recognition particle-docking protein FtsY [Pseudomonas putida]MCO7563454.1 signal recognition particle-docking protein FtsY [Pseudomonas mosselii]MCO7594670.1 signal recognition particle-docking protein FtsY [Pseudomonas guariconensis]MCO7603705.1 signal recognition particle-docking protein FtsY [Pseudomonas gu